LPPPPPPVQVNPALPLVIDQSEFAGRQSRLGDSLATEGAFGNAVDVALLILKTPPDQLLDWDLDGDPGIGYPTWLLPSPTSPRSAAVSES
jgi:hypothetical protein